MWINFTCLVIIKGQLLFATSLQQINVSLLFLYLFSPIGFVFISFSN